MCWLSIDVSLHCFLEIKSEELLAKAKRKAVFWRCRLQQHSLSTYGLNFGVFCWRSHCFIDCAQCPGLWIEAIEDWMCPCYATNLYACHVKSWFSRRRYNKPVNMSQKRKVMEQLVTQPVSSGILNLNPISKYIMYFKFRLRYRWMCWWTMQQWRKLHRCCEWL